MNWPLWVNYFLLFHQFRFLHSISSVSAVVLMLKILTILSPRKSKRKFSLSSEILHKNASDPRPFNCQSRSAIIRCGWAQTFDVLGGRQKPHLIRTSCRMIPNRRAHVVLTSYCMSWPFGSYPLLKCHRNRTHTYWDFSQIVPHRMFQRKYPGLWYTKVPYPINSNFLDEYRFGLLSTRGKNKQS